MPTRREGPDDGPIRFVRTYDAAEYSVPAGEIENLRYFNEGYGSTTLLADGRDGPFACFTPFCCFQRDGARWIVLWNWMENWAIEVELTSDHLGDIYPLSPETAWHIAVARDREDVRVEGDTPPPPAWLRGV